VYGKRYQKFILLLTSGLIAIPQTVASADVKKVGRTTATTTVNTILSGKGVPAASIGINGDFYIDKVNLNFYGPKANGLWPLPVSMRGPAGAAGNDGKNGVDGKAGTTTVAAGGSSAPGPAGPAGPAGAKGDQGDAGPAGPAGPSGTAGAAGTPGQMGNPGTPGAKGDPGAQGERGLPGDKGDPGTPGAKGDTGSPGAKGDPGTNASVPAIYGNIPFPNIDPVSPFMASTQSFGNFVAGKFYLVNIFITAHTTFYDSIALKFSIVKPGIPCFYTATTGNNGSDGSEKTYASIHAMVLVDGSAISPDGLSAKVTNYSDIAGTQIIINANYVALEVGSMTQV
jgi:hypothetical protein